MTLSAGTRLGPHEILAPIGAGGMGEVYRARDERLKREVAIKVLPASHSQDAERLRRFEQNSPGCVPVALTAGRNIDAAPHGRLLAMAFGLHWPF